MYVFSLLCLGRLRFCLFATLTCLTPHSLLCRDFGERVVIPSTPERESWLRLLGASTALLLVIAGAVYAVCRPRLQVTEFSGPSIQSHHGGGGAVYRRLTAEELQDRGNRMQLFDFDDDDDDDDDGFSDVDAATSGRSARARALQNSL